MASLLLLLSVHYLIDSYLFYQANPKEVRGVITHIEKVSLINT